MLAILGVAVSAISGLFSVASGGVLTALKAVAMGLGLRFYAGLAVGLFITDNKVRSAAIDLGKGHNRGGAVKRVIIGALLGATVVPGIAGLTYLIAWVFDLPAKSVDPLALAIFFVMSIIIGAVAGRTVAD